WAAISLAVLVVAITAITALPFRDSPAVLQTIVNATAGGQRYTDSLVDIPSFPIVARFLDRLSEHIAESLAQVRFWEAVIVRTLFVVYVGWEIRLLWRARLTTRMELLHRALEASLRTMLLGIIFVLTQTLDYYFITALALGAVLGWRNRWTL